MALAGAALGLLVGLAAGLFGLLALLSPVAAQTATTGICSRTAEVQTALLAATSRTACADVTAADLVAVTSLTVSSYSGAVLDPADFAGLTGLTNLVFDGSPQLTTLPDNAFAGVTALTHLDFSSLVTVTMVAEDAFSGLTALENLNLSDNLITTLDEDTFDGLTALRILDLSYTSLASLDADIFDGLTALEYLDLSYLSYADQTTLHADLFDGLTALVNLNLSSNLLTTLHADIFDGLTALEYLDLDSNRLTTLHADIFDGLTDLEELDLNTNLLTTLHADIFDGLTDLEELDLNSNLLTTLDADIFDGLIALNALDLGQNGLTTLHADIFDGLTALENLNLSGNGLTTLDADTFDGLIALRILDLSVTSLESLDADIFDGLTALIRVLLSANLLTTLDADIFDRLTLLQEISLDRNSLDTLDADIFDGLTVLQKLQLQDNRLTALHADIFDGLTALDLLDLNCNYFTALDLNIFDPFAATLTSLNLQSDSFTTPPTDAAIRAKFPMVMDPLTGVTTCDRVTVSPTSLTVTEGATGTLSVALRSLPTDVVTLAISSDNPDVTVTPTTALTFTVANWDTAQTVTVSAAQDPDQADESATLILDPGGDGNVYPFVFSTALTVTVTDDDEAQTGICSRALAVQTPILTATSRTACADVTTADLASVTTLSIMAYGSTSIDPADFAGLTGLTSLWISASPQLTTVPDNAFAGLTALTTLNFNVLSSLTTLGEDAFAGLTTLENLNLSVNLLTTLHADIFDGLTALGRLELQDNLLTTLDEDIFDGLTALNSLELNNNRSLAALDADIFDGLTALEYLDLSSTNQTALDADIFDDLTALKTLYLSGNSLTTLDADIFDGLTALETLVLNINSLTTLDADIFDGLTALDTLSLNNNSLTTLDADIFDGLTALIKLYLNSNLLTTLDADIFDGLTALYDLRLDQNSLSTLDADIFDGLTALGYLELQDNRLTALDADIFDGITLLERLDLECNYFTALDLDIFDPFAATLTHLNLMSDSFTTPPVASAILAKFLNIDDFSIGVTTCSRVTVSPTSLTVDEGATGTYTVALRAQPTANVMVAISSDNSDVTLSPAGPLTFTASNWDTPQMVTVSAAQDSDDADDSATLILDPSDADYDSVSSTPLTVTVTDDDGTADTTAPRVASIARQTPTSSPTNADSLTWRVTFSEAVSNVNAADFAVSGTTATVTAVAVSGLTGAYDVSASGGNLAALNATVTLAIASSHNIEDAASNALSNTTPTGTNNNSYIVDNTAPSVTISGVPASSDAPFRATFTFSEAVTGFAVGDIRLDSASGSSFTVTSTTVYRALVTPTAAGTVTVDVPANAARDAAGNGNTAATQASSTYSGTVIPAAMLPTVTLRTQSVPESIGTAMLVVTLDQPASAPLSVPWYTLSSTAASPGDYTNGAGTLIIPSGVTNATISITIIDDAVEELTETVLVLLSPGDGYELGGSGATVSILDDDGDGPAPSGATVDGATVVLTYNEPLDGASTPSSTAFVLRVAGDPVSINEVSVDGSEVTLTLAAPVPAGQTVSLDYTAPVSNPIQDASGNKAQSFTRWYLVTESTITITNPVITVPGAPTALSATAVGNTQINLSWTAPGENGGAPISGYKIESSPDGVANWTELVANTGNANTTYEHLGLTFGTTRHYRVSAINSVGAGDPSNIDDATAIIPTVTLRTQTVLESIGTAVLAVTLDQPAGDPLSVPWYTLSSTAASPGDYTNGEGTLIIPSGVTNATISITIIDDAVEEPTETFLVLLSSGTGYDLGGSGATVSILDDDGDGPAPIRATVNGTTVVLTYNKPLDGASTPSSTAFHLRMAGDPVSINEVSVDGSEVTLTLASPVQAGQTVSLDYTQPMSNPIQDGSGNKAQSFTRWYLVTGSTMTGTVDTTAPSVTISGVPATSDAPFTATFTFSEAVTGFAVGDITLGNATASSFTSTSTTVYRALVTPTAAGAVTVDVSANAAQDAAGNGNTAATRASSTYTGSATRGVTVFATALTVNEGTTGTYTVVLDSQPTANVTVTPSRTGSTDVTFSPATLTFTALNWNTVQPVTVTAAQDSDAVDDSATISHAVTGGDYVGVTVESVVVRVNDDESVDTVPGVPTDLSASTGGDTRINLSWTAPGDDGGSPITGYKIEVSPDGNANWTGLVANTGNTTTTYAHIGLAVGTTRHYRVSAINSVGAGDPSNIDDATTRPITGPITGGGGGGGGPTPSEVDFEWNVKRDIEELDGGNDRATGVWSDGTTLWVADNADGAGDSVYAYDLATGERVESREFALADTNRAPRGIWSDRSVVWVSDSGRERLFAYRLADGERVEEREFALAAGNSDARGIWSDEETMWVLDGRADALFAYDFESGELLAEYALDAANDDPHGIWSDGVTIWVSDHGAKRLFAYRLPVLPDAETDSGAQGADDDARELERVRDEEFSMLSRASNNSPRGIWSDGDVMYVADESDDRVYSYNMPDAADARLASLTLSGVDIGEFDPGRTEYEAVVADGVTATTVEAEAMQRRTDVAIDPPDADVEADGHQVALQDLGEVIVTVTSADGSRTKTYRVRLGEEEAAGPVAGCLRGDIAVGFSLVVYAGGSIEDLVACAEGRNVAALYVLDGGEWVSYILGAPEFVNRSFAGLFAEGLAALTPLIARSDGPASPDPSGDEPRPGDATQPWPACLQGEIAEGFNLVVYEGGSVGELEGCARSADITALYALSEGEFVSYILGAPGFVTQPFRDLFADDLPPMTPLVARSEGQPGDR